MFYQEESDATSIYCLWNYMHGLVRSAWFAGLRGRGLGLAEPADIRPPHSFLFKALPGCYRVPTRVRGSALTLVFRVCYRSLAQGNSHKNALSWASARGLRVGASGNTHGHE